MTRINMNHKSYVPYYRTLRETALNATAIETIQLELSYAEHTELTLSHTRVPLMSLFGLFIPSHPSSPVHIVDIVRLVFYIVFV